MGFVGEGRLEMFSTQAEGFVPVCAEDWVSSDTPAARFDENDWSRKTCRMLGYEQAQVRLVVISSL